MGFFTLGFNSKAPNTHILENCLSTIQFQQFSNFKTRVNAQKQNPLKRQMLKKIQRNWDLHAENVADGVVLSLNSARSCIDNLRIPLVRDPIKFFKKK